MDGLSAATDRPTSQFYFHTPRRPTSANGMNHRSTCLCLPSQSGYSFTDLRGIKDWVGLGRPVEGHKICYWTFSFYCCSCSLAIGGPSDVRNRQKGSTAAIGKAVRQTSVAYNTQPLPDSRLHDVCCQPMKRRSTTILSSFI